MAPQAASSLVRQDFARNLQARVPVLGRGSRRTVVIVHSRQRGFATESLEHAIQAINKIIFEQEQRRQRQRASRADGTTKEVEVQPISKPITFKASAKTEKLVKEPAGPSPSPRGLSAYLALPLDQYSLLDPGWISRSPAAPDVFVLRIPLFDLVGVELQPQVTVRVSLDPRNNQVHFLADQFKVGDPRFDEDFKLDMRATLRNKPVTTLRPFRSIKRMWARAGNGASGKTGAANSAWGAVAAAVSTSAAAPAAPQAVYDGSGTVSSDEDDIIVQVEGVEDDGSDGDRGAPTNTRGGRAGVRDAYGEYDPGAVLDVGLNGRSSGTAGARPVPDLPPHVFVVPEVVIPEVVSPETRMAPAAGSTSSAESNGHGSNSSSNGLGANATVLAGSNGTSKSGGLGTALYMEAGDGRHGSASAAGKSGSAAARVEGTSSAGGGDGSAGGARTWPSGSYGPSLPATSPAATAAAPATSAAAEAVAGGGAPGAAPAPAVHSAAGPRVITAPAGAVAGAARAAAATTAVAGAAGAAAVAAPVAAVRVHGPIQPVAAAAAAAAAVAVAPAAAASPPAAGTLPFIEDEVLYVPATQWGRSGDSVGAAPASRNGGSGALGALGSGARPVALHPAPGAAGSGNGTSMGSGVAGAAAAASEGAPARAAGAAAAVAAAVHGAGQPSSGSGGAAAAAAAPTAPPLVATLGRAAANSPTAASSQPHASPAPPGPPTRAPPQPQPTNAASGAAPLAPAAAPEAADPPERAQGGGASEPGAAQPPAVAADRAFAPSAVVTTPSAHQGSAAGGGASAGDDGPTALLVGNVDVSVTVMMPPALAAVPRPLLGMTGSLIARYAISSLLPSFLDLLVADYGRWSSGQTVAARAEPAGDLAAVAVANAAAMGATTGRSAQAPQAPPAPAAPTAPTASPSAVGKETGQQQ